MTCPHPAFLSFSHETVRSLSHSLSFRGISRLHMLSHFLLVFSAWCAASGLAMVFERRTTLNITAQQLLVISPGANTCNGSPYIDECRTAAQAAPLISAAFGAYDVNTPGEAAALVSLMAFESGDFKYQKNHFPAPGRPGQGTRNMQSAAFNFEYASSIPALHSSLATLTGAGAGAPSPAASTLSSDTQNAIRQLVLADQYDFASAAWFLTTQCGSTGAGAGQDIRAGLQTIPPSEAAWEAYITSCVGTTVTDARKAYWNRAVASLSAGAGKLGQG